MHIEPYVHVYDFSVYMYIYNIYIFTFVCRSPLEGCFSTHVIKSLPSVKCMWGPLVCVNSYFRQLYNAYIYISCTIQTIQKKTPPEIQTKLKGKLGQTAV